VLALRLVQTVGDDEVQSFLGGQHLSVRDAVVATGIWNTSPAIGATPPVGFINSNPAANPKNRTARPNFEPHGYRNTIPLQIAQIQSATEFVHPTPCAYLERTSRRSRRERRNACGVWGVKTRFGREKSRIYRWKASLPTPHDIPSSSCRDGQPLSLRRHPSGASALGFVRKSG
jgi:hypothetical protein